MRTKRQQWPPLSVASQAQTTPLIGVRLTSHVPRSSNPCRQRHSRGWLHARSASAGSRYPNRHKGCPGEGAWSHMPDSDGANEKRRVLRDRPAVSPDLSFCFAVGFPSMPEKLVNGHYLRAAVWRASPIRVGIASEPATRCSTDRPHAFLEGHPRSAWRAQAASAAWDALSAWPGFRQ